MTRSQRGMTACGWEFEGEHHGHLQPLLVWHKHLRLAFAPKVQWNPEVWNAHWQSLASKIYRCPKQTHLRVLQIGYISGQPDYNATGYDISFLLWSMPWVIQCDIERHHTIAPRSPEVVSWKAKYSAVLMAAAQIAAVVPLIAGWFFGGRWSFFHAYFVELWAGTDCCPSSEGSTTCPSASSVQASVVDT